MSSPTTKLDNLGGDDRADEPITGFENLATVLMTDGMFSNYIKETPDDDVVSVERDGLVQVYLAPRLWQSFERRAPFLERAGDPNLCVVCTGSFEDLNNLPIELRRPEVQTLGLPVSRLNMRAVINSIHNFQTLVSHSNSARREVEEANENVKYVMSISRVLNGERDIDRLLNLILQKAREICNADAGSIYTISGAGDDIRDGTISFRFSQNFSIVQNLTEFTMPVNEGSVVGNAAIHQTAINIPDLYKLSDNPDENPYRARHDRTWDKRIGYESHSMLTVPMFDISHRVIGVIQLINRKKTKNVKLLTPEDFGGQVIPFDEVDQEYAEIVAQQAGIALENARLADDIQNLFDGFVNASVTAIEQRDPTTSGHSHRVAHLTCGLADVINRTPNGIYARINFSDDQMQEIKYASLLHDFGKLGVRENVLVKAKKLYPWQFDLVDQRFELIRAEYEIEYLKKVIEYLQNPDHFPMGANPYTFEAEKQSKIEELTEFFDFVSKSNEPTVLEQGGFEKLKDIANLAFKMPSGKEMNFLLSDELKALQVSRGSLTREEFAEIQSHVTHTYDFLRKIPWGRRLANVPQIAAKHHEKLDGSGYPTSAGADEIPVQTRIMTIADIFDALTAADRPYKRAVPVDRALDILEMEVKGGKLDPDLFQLFLESKVYEEVLDPGFKPQTPGG